MSIRILKIFIINLLLLLISGGLNAYACGSCSPSPFSLFYNYVVPNKVKAYTNPYLQANSIVNAIRNPRSLATPCGFSNTYVNGRLLLTNPSYPTQTIQQYNSTYTANNLSNTTANAYISGYNLGETSNQNDSLNGYYDTQSQSYVWILPERKD